MKKSILFLGALVIAVAFCACDVDTPTSNNSDQKQQQQQEQMLQQGVAMTGMPSIKNFSEKKLLKDIFELRDQSNLSTYTYIVAEQTGKLIFIGHSIGFGIPYATQYTAPQKGEWHQYNGAARYEYQYAILPQADPNGLFSPSSASGTWVLLLDKQGNAKPTYIEPNVIVSQFPLIGDGSEDR